MELLRWFLYLFLVATYVAGFIIPNELPTILSLVYSNIPPLKIGQDTRFGIGFRLGPHADFQTLVEIGPQTNTGQLASPDSPAKRDSNPPPPAPPASALVTQLPVLDVEKEAVTQDDRKQKKTPPKKTKSPFVEKIVFKKVPGIDDR